MTFEAHDPDGELSDEAKERIENLARGIVELVEETAAAPNEALMVIAAVASYIITEYAMTRDVAKDSIARFIMAMSSTILINEECGNVNWDQKSKH